MSSHMPFYTMVTRPKKSWVCLSITKLCSTVLLPFIFTVHACCAASLLVLRWKRAKDTLALTEQSLNQAMSAYAAGGHNIRICYNCILIVKQYLYCVAVSEADVEQWIEEEKVSILSTPPSTPSNSLHQLTVV